MVSKIKVNEKKNIEVSIICLAYNHGNYIRRALNGFVMQKTNFDFEVIVHDDASIDDTKNIIEEYSKKYDYIVPIFQKDNLYSKGVNIARDILLPLARGRYIAFCEGDDYWDCETKLQEQFDALENNENCSICVSKVQFCDADGSYIDRQIPNKKFHFNKTGVIKKEYLAKQLLSEMSYPFQTSSYFMKKDVLDKKFNYMKREFDGQDIYMLRNALLLGDFYYIDKIMSYRRHNVIGSWTYRNKNSDVKDKISYFKSLIENERNYDKFSNYVFHQYITKGIYTCLFKMKELNSKETFEYMKNNSLNLFGMFKELGLKETIKFIFII